MSSIFVSTGMYAYLIPFPLVGVLLVQLFSREVCGAGEFNEYRSVFWAIGPFNHLVENTLKTIVVNFIASGDLKSHLGQLHVSLRNNNAHVELRAFCGLGRTNKGWIASCLGPDIK